MPDSDNRTPLSANDSQNAELRMRRALGLSGAPGAVPQQRADQARPRHKFVQDGGVPVVMLNSRGDNDPTAPFKARIAELEAALDAEQAALATMKRALQEAQAAHQAAQTRLAHGEIAQREALATEARRREAAEEALRARMTPIEHPTDQPKRAARIPREARVPREPRVAKVREPKPVKWWLPTFKEPSR